MTELTLSSQRYPPLQVARRYFPKWAGVFRFSRVPEDLPYFVPATHATEYVELQGSAHFRRFFLYSSDYGLVFGMMKPFFTEYNLDALWKRYASVLEKFYGDAGDLRVVRRVYRVLTEDVVSDYLDGEYEDMYLGFSEREFTQYTLYVSDLSDALPGVLQYGDRYYFYYYSPAWERFSEYDVSYDPVFRQFQDVKSKEECFVAVPDRVLSRIYAEMVKEGWIYDSERR